MAKKRQPQNEELDFSTAKTEATIQIRKFDPDTAGGELRLRLTELNVKIKKLEKAQEISSDLLETTISI